MQFVANIHYSFDEPWPSWFFVGKIISKAFFDDENHLEWLNAVRVGNREFIAFTHVQRPFPNLGEARPEERDVRVVEIDFSKPQPGENLKLFWKPARQIIRQKVKDCE